MASDKSKIIYTKLMKTNPRDVREEALKSMEKEMDKWTSTLPALRNFILPGGSIFSGYINHSRAICRRLERNLVKYGSNVFYIRYVNRLSDLFFVIGRYINKLEEIPETIWKGQ